MLARGKLQLALCVNFSSTLAPAKARSARRELCAVSIFTDISAANLWVRPNGIHQIAGRACTAASS